ncbi:hypothetical protein [Ruegeria sp. ANG-R]|uniref:hypothetical protein n=1 Tax=Ruegeria sp. ANG-R TaxID=1577903 RepID=UPI000B1E5564|nr:hypothetical protein [Ruegeria sp. ANG-R]
MDIAGIKATVDAGRIVHWANEAYLVHKDHLGQYLITYLPNGSTIGLTDLSGERLNGDELDFFIPVSVNDSKADGREGVCSGPLRQTPAAGQAEGLGTKERELWVFVIPGGVERQFRSR